MGRCREFLNGPQWKCRVLIDSSAASSKSPVGWSPPCGQKATATLTGLEWALQLVEQFVNGQLHLWPRWLGDDRAVLAFLQAG